MRFFFAFFSLYCEKSTIDSCNSLKIDIDKFRELLNQKSENTDYLVVCLFITDIMTNGSYIIFNDKAKSILEDSYKDIVINAIMRDSNLDKNIFDRNKFRLTSRKVVLILLEIIIAVSKKVHETSLFCVILSL